MLHDDGHDIAKLDLGGESVAMRHHDAIISVVERHDRTKTIQIQNMVRE